MDQLSLSIKPRQSGRKPGMAFIFLNGGTGLFFGFGLEPCLRHARDTSDSGAMNTVGTTPQGATLLARTGAGHLRRNLPDRSAH